MASVVCLVGRLDKRTIPAPSKAQSSMTTDNDEEREAGMIPERVDTMFRVSP